MTLGVLALAAPIGLILAMLGALFAHVLRAGADLATPSISLWAASLGSLLLALLVLLIALPVGIGATLYLQEIAAPSRARSLARALVRALESVPSVIYGLVVAIVYVRGLGLGRSLLAGGLALALTALPVVMVATREALRQLPAEVRTAALGLGASRRACLRWVIWPAAWPAVLSGAVLALARAIGETAPLLIVGALLWVSYPPTDLSSEFTALPVCAYALLGRLEPAAAAHAAVALLVLMAWVVVLSLVAFAIRRRYQEPR